MHIIQRLGLRLRDDEQGDENRQLRRNAVA